MRNSPHSILAAVLLVTALLATRTLPAHAMSSEAWVDDIRYMVTQIEYYHPDPYRNVPERAFKLAIDELIAQVLDLTDPQIAVHMMQIIARIGDGHTTLHPKHVEGFDTWFPVRFYQFADGLAIMTISKEHESLVGAKVVRIGQGPVEDATAAAMSLMGAENEFGKKERVYFLSNASAMHALGVIDDPTRLPLDVVTRSGEEVHVELETVRSRYDLDFRFHGEYFPPPMPTAPPTPLASPFPNKTVRELLVGDPRLNTDLPLHMRSRKAYWYQLIEGENAVYMQINSATPQSTHSDLSFAETYEEMFRTIDDSNTETFVLDLRWHGGGDGGVNEPFVREIIKRESSINSPGRFFVLVGKKTYSAAAMLVQLLREHTHATFVGEPPGEYCNQFGDPAYVTLPNSRMRITISTLWWQLSRSDDPRTMFPIQIPVQMAIEDYFGMTDPLLAAALAARGRRSIYQIATEDGVAGAIAAYDARRTRFGRYEWWSEVREDRINDLAYEILASGAEDDVAHAAELFRINTESHPLSWNAWDSYGEALAKMGRNKDSARAYQRALEANPRNWNSQAQKAMIAKLTGQVE